MSLHCLLCFLCKLLPCSPLFYKDYSFMAVYTSPPQVSFQILFPFICQPHLPAMLFSSPILCTRHSASNCFPLEVLFSFQTIHLFTFILYPHGLRPNPNVSRHYILISVFLFPTYHRLVFLILHQSFLTQSLHIFASI